MATLLACGLLVGLTVGRAAAGETGFENWRVAAASLDAGGSHTCAVTKPGGLRCWGADASGELGHDSVTNVGDGTLSITSAGDVPLGPDARPVGVAAGTEHTCALLAGGAVRCWGLGAAGQLGHDDTSNVGDGQAGDLSIDEAGDVPLGPDVQATAVTAGGSHTCALLSGGAVRCWGDGTAGELGHDSVLSIGDGIGADPSIATAGDVPLAGQAVAITAGRSHTCALMAGGTVRCWGLGDAGRLGYDSGANVGDGAAADVSIESLGDVPLTGKVTAITAGDNHTCALMSTGGVRCWGEADQGQLGYDDRVDVGDGSGVLMHDLTDVPLGGTAVAVSAGGDHTCAVLNTGTVRCWGEGADGELGYGTTANVGDGVAGDRSIEQAGDVPLGGPAVAISAGEHHTCALLITGTMRCWGKATSGQLGHDGTSNVGDGAPGDLSIEQAGDVPIGSRVRLLAPTSVSATLTPSRDRWAPYVYKLSGRITSDVPTDPTTCVGEVRSSVRQGRRLLVTSYASVDHRTCGYHARIRIRAGQLHAHTRTRLTVHLLFLGNTNLHPSGATRYVVAH